MKWIGQHIYDLVSRFRDDVYLEDLSTTTETNVLVVDSTGKVSKSTTLADDLESDVEASIDTLANLTAIGTASNNLIVTNDQINFNSVNANDPLIIIKNAANDATSSRLRFLNARGADGQDNDECGIIQFYSYDDGTPSGEEYATIKATIHDATATEESGKLQLQVASHDGGTEDGLVLTGGSVDAEVDVTIGNGAASVVTIPGIIGTGVWNGTAIGGNYVAATQPNIDSIGTDGDTLGILGDKLQMYNTTTNKPEIELQNRTDDATGPIISFTNNRQDGGTQAGEDSDVLGKMLFVGYDDQGTPATQTYAGIVAKIHDATSGEESGKLTFSVANHDGDMGDGLILTGGSADNEIDVTLGLGAASDVSMPGHLIVGKSIDIEASDAAIMLDSVTILSDSSGTATLSNIDALDATTEATIETAIDTLSNLTAASSLVTVGTIGTGVWQGTAIATAYIADDAVTFAKASGVSPNVFGNIIKLLPSDFAANIDGGNTKLGVGYTDTAGSAYGMKVGSANTELFAFVSIPEGMTATHVDVFDKDDRALEVFEVQINATSLTSKGSGNCNTTLDITDVDASATNFLAIKVTTTATTDKVFGGKVTIA